MTSPDQLLNLKMAEEKPASVPEEMGTLFIMDLLRWKNATFDSMADCNENPIYVFPEKELCAASVPNFHILLSVSDLFIPGIGPHFFLQQNRQTHHGNI